ncbi:MAG: adenosylcobalamin-dependent ribonucleoside-diphosphate reductase [Thiogranum sp.]|nr:adenosylcobalamin-dependent ribonucleoside-diphosphate reductase [Thiogranum sp.]
MSDEPFTADVSRDIWDTKYRWRDGDRILDQTLQDTWRRVATALAQPEADPRSWEQRFYDALTDFRFLPGGRILAGAGTGRSVTLFNCFVMGILNDSLDGIFDGLKEGALTMQQGGGVGYDFSTLRPQGSVAQRVGVIASGPVSFMRIWDAMCATLLSTGARRGAMMATLRCDHPDVEAFIDAKRGNQALRHFNLSVLVGDDFMHALDSDADWQLVFPIDADTTAGGDTVLRQWSGSGAPVPCRVVKTVRARALWERLMGANYESAEPGVIFVDRVNQLNNLHYEETISATNPCGEIPLPPYGACDLGAINLPRFVRNGFSKHATLDFDALRALVPTAVRMLDNVIDVSRFPLPQQAQRARHTRRIGLGITGLADALILLGLHYGEPAARRLAAQIMRTICHEAYRASVSLAHEKGPCPAFDSERYVAGPFIRSLPDDIQADIARSGVRNSHLIAIAPAGTISLLANNVSSGLEPVYDFKHRRRILQRNGTTRDYELTDWAWAEWYRARRAVEPSQSFVTAQELEPEAHLQMHAALQPYVDNSISKTINVPHQFTFQEFENVYRRAYALGLKSCTTFRPTESTGAVLSVCDPAAREVHCCTVEREAD